MSSPEPTPSPRLLALTGAAVTADLTLLQPVLPPDTASTAALRLRLAQAAAGNGYAWLLLAGADTAVAYALATPVAGLPGVFELAGGVAPARQRRGDGRRLLAAVTDRLAPAGARQLSVCLPQPDHPALGFLTRHGFSLEHEELLLRRPTLAGLPAPTIPPGWRLASLPQRAAAAALFRRLYDASFGPHPWYQPYGPGEVAAALARPTDLLFLWAADDPAGFAWLHRPAGGPAEVEPLGVLPAYQGRGHGHRLLTAALHALARDGARSVQIGAWRRNAPALALYRQLGFRPHQVLTYLARSL